MKKKIETNLNVIGMCIASLGITVLADYKYIQYPALIIGLFLMIYSVFLNDREKKKQKK